MCIRRRGWFVIRRGNATVWRGGTARKVRFPRGFHAFPSRDRRKYESDEPCGEGGRGSARECKVGRRTSGCERGGGGGRKVQAGDLALSEWKRGVEHAATARRSTHLSQGHILDPHRGLPCVSGDARADERRAVGAHRPFAATHALFSPDLCNARTCATPSLQAVSSLLYRSGASNFDDRPVLPYLPSQRTGLLFADTNDTILLFSFLSFSPIDAAGRSRIFPSRESGARVEEWVAAEVRVCALFPPAGEEREGARVARSTPIGRRRHPPPISEDQRFLNPVARVCVAS